MSVSNLNSTLKQSGDIAAEADEAYKTIVATASGGGAKPRDEEIRAHFLQRSYFYDDVDPEEAKNSTEHEIEAACFEFLDRGIFARYSKRSHDAETNLMAADKLAKYLKSAFLSENVNFITGLSDQDLLTKLHLEVVFFKAATTLSQGRRNSQALIGQAMNLAEQINDPKRKLDLQMRWQYYYYELYEYPYLSIALGHHVLNNRSDYRDAKVWANFHIGNACLDIDEVSEATKYFDQAYTAAKNTGHQIGCMTLRERQALAARRAGDTKTASKFYQEALQEVKKSNIPYLATTTTIRCQMGQAGLLQQAAAKLSGQDKEKAYRRAETQLKQAASSANAVSYTANYAASLSSLGDLYREWRGDGDLDAKLYHQMAFNVKTTRLGLDGQQGRVKHDAQKMKK